MQAVENAGADERDLVARCLARDERAWGELARRYGRLAASRAAGILSAKLGRADPDAVQEAVQETFLRLAAGQGRLLARFAWRSKLSTYVAAVAGFATLDIVRKTARAEAGEGRFRLAGLREESGPEADPASVLLGREAVDRLERSLAGLPARDRLVVRMRFWDGAETGAIARVLDLDPAYVRVVLARALEKTRKIMISSDTPGGDPPTHG